MNEYLNNVCKTSGIDYVIASDTDSLYLNLGPLVDQTCDGKTDDGIIEWLDKVSNKVIQPYIDKCYCDLDELLNAYAHKLLMKRESIASRGIWVGKKRYMLLVHDNEGVRYNDPEFKVVGMEAVRSDRPLVVREALKSAYKTMLAHGEEPTWGDIEKFHAEYMNLPLEEIGIPIGTNDLNIKKLGMSGLQMNYRAALVYNELLNTKGIVNLQRIQAGSRARMWMLKSPNPTKYDVIAAPNELPSELGLDEYVDREAMFKKAYLAAMENAMQPIGWNTERKSSLMDFFG